MVDDDAAALPFLGSLMTKEGPQFRVTMRCLREDLKLVPPVAFADLLQSPVGSTILGHASGSAEDLKLSRTAARLGGLVLHPSAEDRVLWIVACGLDGPGCAALDGGGRLWPMPDDRRWLADDRFALGVDNLRIKAPLALAQARSHPGEPCEIAGLDPGAIIRVVVDPAHRSTYVELSAPHGEHLSPERGRRRVVVSLACVHPSPAWVVVEDEPEGKFVVADPAETPAAFLVFQRADQPSARQRPWGPPRRLNATDFKLKNVAEIRQALDRHAEDCDDAIQGILLHPLDYMALAVEELWGIPVIADETVTVKRCVLRCLGDRHRTEMALEAFLDDATRTASLG